MSMTDRLSRKASRTRLWYLPILGGALLCIVFLFSACDGFMDDGGTREQIKNKLEYSDAPSYKIKVEYSGKTGIVNAPTGGETFQKVTDTFPLKFKTTDDYDFLYWTITDGEQELTNGQYLQLASLYNQETECTFIKAPEPGMQLCLTPVVIERPSIGSTYPEKNPKGVPPDTSIVVNFDKSMSLDSIYYTQDEIDELNQKEGLTFLSVNIGTDNRKYGYKIGNNNATIVFKNIKIEEMNSTNPNLLQYFNAPAFNEARNELTIAVKTALPDGTSVRVTIDKKFSTKYEPLNKSITLSKSEIWPYFAKIQDQTP